MINSIIIKYLKENRRLVVPKLGAFIVKDDNQTVIFSELLRSDDGVLRALIKDHGVGDIEAAGVIDRFVFEVRHTLDRNMPYKIGSWGTLRRNENGKVIFTSFRTPEQIQTAPRPIQRTQPAAVTVPAEPAAKPAEREEAAERKPMATAPRKRPTSTQKKRPDIFMIVAVIIAILAVGAILYGVLCNKEENAILPFPVEEEVYNSGFDAADEFYPATDEATNSEQK